MSAVVTVLSAGEAQRLTQRIKLTASTVRDSLFKLQTLVNEAKDSNAWQVLGFASWTAYLSDTLADEPMRLGRVERQELVGYLSGEGLSTRAIAPIVGVSHQSVANDISGVNNLTPGRDEEHDVAPQGEVFPAFDEATGEVIEEAEIVEDELASEPSPRPVTGLDGKRYSRPQPKPDRRRSLVDDAYSANTNLWKAIEAIRSIRSDDRYTRNKADILAALQPSADLALEILADLFDTTPKEN